MKHSLGLLPGFGCLFAVRDFRLQTLHKSLFEWLASPANPFRVDRTEGHRLWAAMLAPLTISLAGRAAPSTYGVRHVVAHLLGAASATDGEEIRRKPEALQLAWEVRRCYLKCCCGFWRDVFYWELVEHISSRSTQRLEEAILDFDFIGARSYLRQRTTRQDVAVPCVMPRPFQTIRRGHLRAQPGRSLPPQAGRRPAREHCHGGGHRWERA